VISKKSLAPAVPVPLVQNLIAISFTPAGTAAVKEYLVFVVVKEKELPTPTWPVQVTEFIAPHP
jgi:hypothetical protein